MRVVGIVDGRGLGLTDADHTGCGLGWTGAELGGVRGERGTGGDGAQNPEGGRFVRSCASPPYVAQSHGHGGSLSTPEYGRAVSP